MDQARPTAATVAVALLEIVALGSFGLGIFALAISGQVDASAAPGASLALTGVVALGFALLSAVGSVGMWRGRPWGWIAGLVVAVVGLLGIAATAMTGAFQPQLVLGVVVFGVLLVSLALPDGRRHAGVG